MGIILDTSAWIEFFQGTEKGKDVFAAIKKEQAFTSIVSFAEITNWCFKNNLKESVGQYLRAIKDGSQILPLNEQVMISAGKINYERKKTIGKWGMIDSMVLATSLSHNLKILTKDTYFRDLPNAEIL